MIVSIMFFSYFLNSFFGSASINWQNKACKHLSDYPFKMISPNCYESNKVRTLTPQIIKQNGYNFESHEVITPDGYILQIFRIPKQNNDTRKTHPLVLNHGIVNDAGFWTLIGKSSPAFFLADQGYDVWLVNQRDSRYSNNHTTLKPSSYQFWLQSIDDLALGDLPSVLNKIADVTGKAGSLIYMGHSRGSTVMFMYASEFPDKAKELLKGVVAVAPVVYLAPTRIMKVVIPLMGIFSKISLFFHISMLFYPVKLSIAILQTFSSFFPSITKIVGEAINGKTIQLSPENFMAYFSHFPSSISFLSFLHYIQMYSAGKFQKYDYGKTENLKMYGRENPPPYNLSKFDLPLYMFYGKNDAFIKEKVVKKIHDEISSKHKYYFHVPIGVDDKKWQFSHCDYGWSDRLDEYFYKDLLKALENLSELNDNEKYL